MQRAGTLVPLRFGNAVHFQTECDVVDDGTPWKQIEILPDHDRVMPSGCVLRRSR